MTEIDLINKRLAVLTSIALANLPPGSQYRAELEEVLFICGKCLGIYVLHGTEGIMDGKRVCSKCLKD